MKRYALFSLLLIALTVICASPAICQDNKTEQPAVPAAMEPKETPATPAVPVTQAAPSAAVTAPAEIPSVPVETKQAKDISIYGEVQATDLQANTMTVQYYDYDSDEEKTMDITVTTSTKFENAALLNDIKKGNWVDVTYAVIDGKNTASSIIVEKEEAVPATETEAAPAPATPDE